MDSRSPRSSRALRPSPPGRTGSRRRIPRLRTIRRPGGARRRRARGSAPRTAPRRGRRARSRSARRVQIRPPPRAVHRAPAHAPADRGHRLVLANADHRGVDAERRVPLRRRPGSPRRSARATGTCRRGQIGRAQHGRGARGREAPADRVPSAARTRSGFPRWNLLTSTHRWRSIGPASGLGTINPGPSALDPTPDTRILVISVRKPSGGLSGCVVCFVTGSTFGSRLAMSNFGHPAERSPGPGGRDGAMRTTRSRAGLCAGPQLPLFEGIPSEDLVAAMTQGGIAHRQLERDMFVLDPIGLAGGQPAPVIYIARGQVAAAVFMEQELAERRAAAGRARERDARKSARPSR